MEPILNIGNISIAPADALDTSGLSGALLHQVGGYKEGAYEFPSDIIKPVAPRKYCRISRQYQHA